MNYEEVKLKAQKLCNPIKCDLGPGPWKRPGFYGIDCRSFWEGENPNKNLKVDVDLIHDLNDGIPFPDGTIIHINAGHFMEHVANVYFILDECYRVLKKGGFLDIVVPLYEMHPVDHITCFYPDWFERNIHNDGARYKNKFKIEEKSIKLIELKEEHRAFWELKIKLVKK